MRHGGFPQWAWIGSIAVELGLVSLEIWIGKKIPRQGQGTEDRLPAISDKSECTSFYDLEHIPHASVSCDEKLLWPIQRFKVGDPSIVVVH